MRYIFKLMFVLCLVKGTVAAELTGMEIIRTANDVFNQDQAQGMFELTINTTTGQQRTFVYESFSKNRGEKSLIRYLEPARVKGQATLMLNNADDIWVYFPRTQRVRKLATHAKKQKMEGSNFAYEDLGSGESFLTDFIHQRLPDAEYDGVDCYRVELTVKPGKTSSYSRMIMLIGKKDFMMRTVDYYDEKDPKTVVKRLTIQEIKDIQGVPTPMRMIMKSLDDNSESVMAIVEINYRINLPDEMFTERGLRE